MMCEKLNAEVVLATRSLHLMVDTYSCGPNAVRQTLGIRALSL